MSRSSLWMCGNTHDGGERLIQLRQLARAAEQLMQEIVENHCASIP
jgi:hypothetical protein